jgi:hypothetical protein
MSEILYGLNSLLIAGVLFASMVVALEIGHRGGRRQQSTADAAARDHINAIQSSLLGILALLMAFSFSLALQRFDSRNDAVVDEANAISTAVLRAQLLPASVRGDVNALLHRYIDVRVRSSAVSLDRDADRQMLLQQAHQLLDTAWARARQAVAEDPNPVTTGLFVQALNESMDAYERRDAALRRHVPESILLLLFCAYVMTGGVVGYAAGVAGHRPSLVSYMLVVLIVALAFIIVDLDRPRRGMIRVDQTSLIELKAAMDAATGPSASNLRE